MFRKLKTACPRKLQGFAKREETYAWSVMFIEREGGLKPGELPLLPWARELRDKRKEEVGQVHGGGTPLVSR